MKTFIVSILCFVFGFLIGKLSSYDHKIVTTSTPSLSSTSTQEFLNNLTTDSHNSANNSQTKTRPPFTSVSLGLSNIIDYIPNESISSVMNLFFHSSDLNELDNVNDFAKRYLEEMSSNPSAIDPESFTSLNVSTDQENIFSGTLLSLINTEPVYAHFDVSGGLASGNNKIFSRWTNLDTNEVLFFNRSNIQSDSDKNWVSFTPTGGWTAGSYEVTFYQFGSQLRKLASQNFYIEIKDNHNIEE